MLRFSSARRMSGATSPARRACLSLNARSASARLRSTAQLIPGSEMCRSSQDQAHQGPTNHRNKDRPNGISHLQAPGRGPLRS